MSNLAMAAHHHKHHHKGGLGKWLHHLKLPNLHHLMAVAHGAQGPGPQRMFFIGLVAALILIAVAVRKMRRS